MATPSRDPSRLFELFFCARIQQADADAQHNGGGATAGGGGGQQRSALFCRFSPPGGGGAAVPPADNLSAFCWPLGVEAVRPSAYLVTSEFTFTLTAGDGSRLHGICRRTHDPTFRPPQPSPVGHKGGSGNSFSAAGQKRLPQVICIISQHCWQPFFSKVLEIADQLLAPHAGAAELPSDAPAALFLASLPRQMVAAGPPLPPLGVVLRVPLPYSAAPISGLDPMRRALVPPGRPASEMLLGLSSDAIELEVPPDLGSGAANAGISLARLLWFLTPRQAVTLVASLLLERRIILVARDAETVSAAVHAANALLYPFRWQHIYLPLLPLALKDYLAAPMPYLVGIQADCLPLLRGIALEETVMIDLDRLGSCTPELGSPGDDYFLLPFARELEDVFEVVREHIQSPTEFDSTPKCTELVQDFFLRLVGGYRKFVRPDEEVTPAALALGLDRPLHNGGAGMGTTSGSMLSASTGSKTSSKNGAAGDDENPRAHGFVFDQAAFVLSHRRKDKITSFLQQFRNSQMLEVFINERLQLASEGYVTDEPFEQKVAERATRLGLRLGIPGVGMVAVPGMAVAAAGKGRIGSLLRKAGSVVKQSGAGLAASISKLGSTQQEAELQIAARSHSGPNLARISPSAHGLGLARRSPVPVAASLVAHSRGNSFSGSSRPSSRSSSYNNLARASANLAALNGGVQPSLEQLRPDMFFGVDDEDEDDGSSVASKSSQEAAWSGPGRSGAAVAGPLGAALGARPSFGSLFHAASSYSPPPQHQSPAASPLGSRAASLQHAGSRLGTTESYEQQVMQQQAQQHLAEQAGSGWGSASPFAAAAVGAAAGSLAGKSGMASPEQSLELDPAGSKRAAVGPTSPATLFGLASPAPLKAPQLMHPRPQQLFPDLPAAQMAAPGAAVSRSGSIGGWATFDDAPDLRSAAAFGSPQGSGSMGPAAPGGGPQYILDSTMGPLGSGMSSVVRQSSSSGNAATAAAARAAIGAAGAGYSQHSQQQEYAGQPQGQWQGFSEQQQQQQQHSSFHLQTWQEQQAPPSLYEQPAFGVQRQPHDHQQLHQHQQHHEHHQHHQHHEHHQHHQQHEHHQHHHQQQYQQPSSQQQLSPPKQPPPARLDGVTTGWAPYGHEVPTGSPAGQPAPAMPAVCRQTAHSPLAAGIASVHRIASLSHMELRRSSSSSGGGSSSIASIASPCTQQHRPQAQVPLYAQPGDAFADLALAAATDASEHMPSRQHTTTSGGADFHSPLRQSSTSSWGEWAGDASAVHTGNPFQTQPSCARPSGVHPPLPPQPQGTLPHPQQHLPAQPPSHQQPSPQHQQAALVRQLTAGARTTSWGEWAGPPPPSSAGVLASQLSSLRLN